MQAHCSCIAVDANPNIPDSQALTNSLYCGYVARGSSCLTGDSRLRLDYLAPRYLFLIPYLSNPPRSAASSQVERGRTRKCTTTLFETSLDSHTSTNAGPRQRSYTPARSCTTPDSLHLVARAQRRDIGGRQLGGLRCLHGWCRRLCLLLRRRSTRAILSGQIPPVLVTRYSRRRISRYRLR